MDFQTTIFLGAIAGAIGMLFVLLCLAAVVVADAAWRCYWRWRLKRIERRVLRLQDRRWDAQMKARLETYLHR